MKIWKAQSDSDYSDQPEFFFFFKKTKKKAHETHRSNDKDSVHK